MALNKQHFITEAEDLLGVHKVLNLGNGSTMNKWLMGFVLPAITLILTALILDWKEK